MKYKLSKLQDAVLSNAEQKHDMRKSMDMEGTGDELLDRIKVMTSVVKPPKLYFTNEEQMAIYDSIVDVVSSGESPEQIASWVVQMLNNKMDEIKAEATGEDMGTSSFSTGSMPSGGVFRRSEQ